MSTNNHILHRLCSKSKTTLEIIVLSVKQQLGTADISAIALQTFIEEFNVYHILSNKSSLLIIIKIICDIAI